MDKEERYQYIDKICKQKNINSETKLYIKRYIQLNEKLFGEFLDIDEVTDRIISNLNYSIYKKNINIFKKNPLKRILILMGAGGVWDTEDHSIFINSKIRRVSQRRNSVLMHELDHCATAKEVVLTEKQFRKIVKYALELKKIKNPIQKRLFINKLYRKFEKDNRVLNITGISDNLQEAKNGVELRELNEGITAWKQEMYDIASGIKPRTGYVYQKQVAKFIGDIIGKEELIKHHFNNDYQGIKDSFYEKTGRDLNELVKVLNDKPKFRLKYKFFKKKREKYSEKMNEFSKKLYECMEEIKPKNGKTDFIPKYNIDESSINEHYYVEPNKSSNMHDINPTGDGR